MTSKKTPHQLPEQVRPAALVAVEGSLARGRE